MDIQKLIAAREKLDLAKNEYDKEVKRFIPRAQQIAELMKELDTSLVINDNKYKLSSRTCFRTKYDYRGLCANKISFSEDGNIISYSCQDWENEIVGSYEVFLQDFIKNNWKEYFSQLIKAEIDLRETENRLKDREKDYERFLKLKEKLEL